MKTKPAMPMQSRPLPPDFLALSDGFDPADDWDAASFEDDAEGWGEGDSGRAAASTAVAWEAIEEDGQDWLDAEQEVQRLLGLDGGGEHDW